MALTKINSNSYSTLDATKLTGNLPAISGASLTGISAGITEYDEWFVTSSFTGDADPISSNWARAGSNTFDKIGIGMSQSSGIFTFPSTGIWKVEFYAYHANNNGNDRNLGMMIQKTVNNNTYDEAAITETGIARNTSAWYYMSQTACATLDITSTSLRKVRFKIVKVDSNTETSCSGTVAKTGVKFMRIGDT